MKSSGRQSRCKGLNVFSNSVALHPACRTGLLPIRSGSWKRSSESEPHDRPWRRARGASRRRREDDAHGHSPVEVGDPWRSQPTPSRTLDRARRPSQDREFVIAIALVIGVVSNGWELRELLVDVRGPDGQAGVRPDAQELPNRVDDNCDGIIDNLIGTWWTPR